MKKPVYFFETCSCNPANGGSGMCGCVIANNIVGYEDDGCNGCSIQQTLLRSETCSICQKILACAEDLYWHLKSHREDLLK